GSPRRWPRRCAGARAPRGSRRWPGWASPLVALARFGLGEDEVHAAGLEIDPDNAHADAVGEAIPLLGAVAGELVAGRVEVEVVAAELGDVHQALDVETVERHEQAEPGHRGDRAVELLADAVLHVVGLEPGVDLARRVVGAALGF